MDRQGKAGGAWQGEARTGMAQQGKAGKTGRGRAWQGMARQAKAVIGAPLQVTDLLD